MSAHSFELMSPSDGSKQSRERRKGLGLTVMVALFATMETASTSFATTSAVSPYTVNVVQCAAGAVTLLLVAASRGQQLYVHQDVFGICMQFGISFWFFLWGYVKALVFLQVVDLTAISVGVSPIVSTVVGCVLLGEAFSAYKVFVLLRNIAVVVIILGCPKADDEASILQGIIWGVVMCIGTAFMRTSQRKIPKTPAATTTFYGYALNTLLWLPPGAFRCRIPFLWPTELQDEISDHAHPWPVWLAVALGGILGALLVALQGVVLVYLDVGTYSMWVSPLYLMLSTVWQGFASGATLPRRALAGVFLQVVGSVIDFWLDQRINIGAH